MLMLRDATLPAQIQTIEVKTIALWKIVFAGAVTGFSIALGTALFNAGARRVGVRT